MVETEIYESKEYKRSRVSYVIKCTAEYFVDLLVADAFLAKLLKYIGLSDSVTGIASSIISLAFLFQIVSVPLVGKLNKVKLPMEAIDTFSQLMFGLLFFVPFLPCSLTVKSIIAISALSLGYFTRHIDNAIIYKWGNSFVSPNKRGVFTASKEMTSLLSGVGYTLLMGYLLDDFEHKGNIQGGFAFFGITIFVLSMINLSTMGIMKNTELSESKADNNLKDILKNILGNKKYRNVIIMTSMTEFARYFSFGFMGTYKTQELGFSVGFVQVINVMGALGRFAVSRPVGKYSDKHSFAMGFYFGGVMQLLSFVVGMFTSPSLSWLIIPYTILINAAQAGLSPNKFNLAYSFVEEDYIMPAMAINNSICGVAGFIGSLLGGALVTYIQGNNNMLFGFGIYAQQFLNFISLALQIATLVFNKKVVCRQKEDKR